MNLEQVDALIEKHIFHRKGRFVVPIRINDRWHDVITWLPYHYSADDPPAGTRIGQMPPPYSTSIEAAWQVVEKMRDVDSFDLGWVTGTKQFRCFILLESPPNCKTEEEVRALDLQRYGWHYAEADTAPLAICLAALKAVGVDVSLETA